VCCVGLVVSHTTQPSQNSRTLPFATQQATTVHILAYNFRKTTYIVFEKRLIWSPLNLFFDTKSLFSDVFGPGYGRICFLHALPQSPNTPTTIPETPQSLFKSVIFDPVSAFFWSRSSLVFHAVLDRGMIKCTPEHLLALPKHAQTNPGPFPMTFAKKGFLLKNVTFSAV
jgi:hypothetical protein